MLRISIPNHGLLNISIWTGNERKKHRVVGQVEACAVELATFHLGCEECEELACEECEELACE